MSPITLEEPLAPPIFVLSAERSGSTLLRYILDTHPQICCPGELATGPTCTYLNALLTRTVCHPGTASDAEAMRSQALAITRQMLSGVMNAYARSKHKSIWCDKTPLNLQHVDLLRATFPTARFVCLYRQCMDVVHSCLEANPYGFISELSPYVARSPGNLIEAMVTSWLEKTESLLAFESSNRTRCFRLKYEDLVRDTDACLGGLFRFLGVPPESDIVSRTFLVTHDQGGGDPKIEFTRGIDPGSIGKGATLPTWLNLLRNYGGSEAPCNSSLIRLRSRDRSHLRARRAPPT